MNHMKRNFLILIAAVLLVIGCSRVPITGRKQFTPIPSSQLLSLSFNSYSDVMQQSQLSQDERKTSMVKNAGRNIQQAVEQYLRENNMQNHIEGFEWEFNLLADQTVNAWAMPGGKIAFYEGIMPICQDETGVAVVMGHEIAHAVAQHGNERMTQGLMQQLGGVALAVALREQPQQTQALAMAAFGIGTTVFGILPFSRRHESEADKMGLIFMAMAGYNPEEAPRFWERMEQQAKGAAQPPEFLSTHPSHGRRIRDLNNAMPEAMEHYRKANQRR
jgi:predicted Zn-dependent protease